MGPSTLANPYHEARVVEREERILEFLPMVQQIARTFACRLPNRVETADLLSAGNLGLIRAVDEFDPSRGVELRIYVAQCVRRSILDYLRAQDPLPYSTRYKIRQIDESILYLEKILKRGPSEREVAEELGFTEADVSNLMAQAASLTLFSLNESQDGCREQERDETRDVLSAIERQEIREILSRLIRELPRQERLVLMFYYYEDLKMKEIGELLEITESRVSQIHARAVALLRAHMRRLTE
ncbi:MAG: FliA/WhiG family RNA polymerase sigma factor [Candidatus Eisenbacteria bacterium]|nr:FliA/WhiG family RNA polymerase sigma factor [Candidatus Eisenbacteria bacterium]